MVALGRMSMMTGCELAQASGQKSISLIAMKWGQISRRKLELKPEFKT